MKWPWLTLLVLVLARATPAWALPTAAEPGDAQRYELTVTLDPVKHEVSGHVRIHFVNHARNPVGALYFHLYPNAFEHDRTVFMREGGGQIRGRRIAQPGKLEIRSLRTAAGLDLLAGADHELIPDDHTQLRTELPVALAPGASLDLELEFVTTLPAIVARSGHAAGFHMLGQWYPKLARLEESGQLASFPYHGLGEFYADFADYTLHLRVPADQVVAASGVRVKSVRDGGFRTDTFVASRVHDVAAAVYPYFERTIAQAGAVRVEVFSPRGYGAAARRQAKLTAAGLRYFSAAYGAYPYPQLSVVLPPRGASAAAGMEYPTLFVSGGPWWCAPEGLPDPSHDPIAAHELAHQWFAGMIASNEVALPMLDEGLAQWSSLDFLRAHEPALQRPPLDPFDLLSATFLFRGHPVPSSLLPAHGYRHDSLARAVYLRPAIVLHAIERRYGRDKLRRTLRRYAEAQRFRHPGIGELYAAFDATFGAGFAERQLRPALEGKSDLAATGPVRPRARRFFADLLFAAQSLVSMLGP